MKPFCALGVDVGGSKIAAALANLETGEILTEIEVATAREQGGEAVLGRVAMVIRQILERSSALGISASGVGLGLPELVTRDGQVASAWNFDWLGLDLARELKLELPLVVDSDVRCGALAERRFGIGCQYRSFSYISIGTGISAVQCFDGRIHRGANGFAIHFGSNDLMPVTPDGRQIAFNLEAFASGAGLSAEFARRTGRKGVSARDLIEGRAGAEGKILADQATTALASYLGQMINLIDPEAMIIGGGLGTAPGYLKALQTKIPQFIWAEKCRAMPIVPSAMAGRAGLLGAACLVATGYD